MAANLKIGVTSWKSDAGWDAKTLCAQAEVAERLGCHSFWLPENHFGDNRAMPSPLTLLAAVSGRTEHIKLGTVSYLLPIRHPLLAAEEVAVLDQLSNGRVILGVGRGIQDSMFRAFDLPSSDKRKRFAENLDVMRRAWAGEAIAEDAQGQAVRLAPLPVQQPSPPIWVAAFGPLALKQVAGLGLPYLASPVETLATLEENYESFHRAVKEAECDDVITVPIMRTVLVSKNRGLTEQLKTALAKTAPGIARQASAGVDEWAIIGDVHEVKDRLAQYVERLHMSHLIASGRLPGLEVDEVIRSHEALLELVG